MPGLLILDLEKAETYQRNGLNSPAGQALKAFPGIEVVKELKEHVEASYEVAGALEEERE